MQALGVVYIYILSMLMSLYFVCVTPFVQPVSSLNQGWVFTRLPAHVSVCDIFFLPCCLPLFVLSGVNEMFVLHICLRSQSSVLHSCFSGGMRSMTDRAALGIRGLKMRDYSNADYYVDYEKKHLYSVWNDENKNKGVNRVQIYI